MLWEKRGATRPIAGSIATPRTDRPNSLSFRCAASECPDPARPAAAARQATAIALLSQVSRCHFAVNDIVASAIPDRLCRAHLFRPAQIDSPTRNPLDGGREPRPA